MKQDKKNFLHESLQDPETIAEILNSITAGLAKGKLTFTDDDNEIVLKPNGLLQLKLTATQDGNQQRLNLKVAWQTTEEKLKKKKLFVKAH